MRKKRWSQTVGLEDVQPSMLRVQEWWATQRTEHLELIKYSEECNQGGLQGKQIENEDTLGDHLVQPVENRSNEIHISLGNVGNTQSNDSQFLGQTISNLLKQSNKGSSNIYFFATVNQNKPVMIRMVFDAAAKHHG
ncbi:hypothetical protein JTB14_009164 [Gonioctena quinquepunctata]|nr:hypothetical protein JTB14_009164 [Gonioctena quinquepunctata]